MGLPDFLKFVARSAPSALYRLPKNTDALTTPIFEFDYILVDATNVSQTVGFERVHALLTSPLLVVHKAVIFALDAQRDRAGTDRFHRQAHVMVGDLDVQVQMCCTKLVDAYKKRAESRPQSVGAGPAAVPLVLMSGRHVAGEADYKLLDLHRHIVCAALSSGAPSPRILFVSEDSDLLCGALCGPAPQNVFIATNLRDTLFEVAILQVSHVVAYVALCVDALAEPVPPQELEAEPEQVAEQALPEVEPEPEVTEEPVALPKPSVPEEDVVRRRKQDGPMIATGVRIALDDSSSDDEAEAPPMKTAVTSAAAAPVASATGATTHAAVTAPPAPAVVPALDDPDRPAAVMIHDSSVDLVFLFLIVMGNGGNVPPLVRGSTKVDVSSCWQAYCAKKFAHTFGAEAEFGKTLLQATGVSSRGGEDEAVMRVNCAFFRSILEALHYADAQSRPPAEEEKGRALAYLSSAVYATLRYVVGCNLKSGAALTETFLDTRPLSDVEVVAPSLSAVLWLLSQESWHQFTYPLRGLSRKELLALRDRHSREEVGRPHLNGDSGHAPAGASSLASSQSAPVAHARGDQKRLQIDVSAALVAPPGSASSWAVRGAGSRTYTLAAVMGDASSATEANSPSPARRSSDATPAPALSVAAHLRAIARGGNNAVGPSLFELLLDIWRTSEVAAMPAFRAIAATAAFLSPVTNTFVDGPLSRNKTWQGGATPAAQRGPTAMVYSFELRRMVPVAATVDTQGAGVRAAAESPPGTRTTPRTATQEAVRAALGLSLSYDKPAAQEAAVPARAKPLKLPREAMDDDDLAEMNRLKKVARKEKERFRKALGESPSSAPAKGKGKAKQKAGDGATKEGAAVANAKRSKRPGKKERQRLHAEAKEKRTDGEQA